MPLTMVIFSFLKMISAAAGGTVVNYSDRFTLTGMTGTFQPNVAAGIKSTTGTGGPATENNVKDSAKNGDGAGGQGTPYSLQTGLTKYAPMQRKPGTKITLKTASMQYPTSAFVLAKSPLPVPSQVTTITASVTYSVASIENPVCPQSPTRRLASLPSKNELTVARPLLHLHQRTTCKNSSIGGGIEYRLQSCCLFAYLCCASANHVLDVILKFILSI